MRVQTFEEAVRDSHRNPRVQEFQRSEPDRFRSAWRKVEDETERLHQESDWKTRVFLIVQHMYFDDWEDNDVWDFILPIASKKLATIRQAA